jgi:hypothetical protein
MLFLKLDIAKAFDSLNWGYLLQVLKHMGFGQRWRDIIALLLASSSSRVLLNGYPGIPFFHRRGLRQGDPLSPMLFILAMEPLQRLLEKATANNVLSPLTLRAARLRASFYADDAALFLNPCKADITAVHHILQLFGDVSGLRTSFQKCVAYPIACSGLDVDEILQDFGGTKGELPCFYLGLPLGLRKPRRIEVQPLFDRAVGRLKGWKGKMMTRKGRLTLVNSVVTATATYFLTIFPAEKWMIKKFDRLRRNFLWNPDDEARGGKCLVNWKRICAPTMNGGLGIKDLEAFSRALRLRWEWYSWEAQDRPWKGTPTPCDLTDKALFAACTSISIGNGETSKFWADSWLFGQAPAALAPLLFKLASRKNLTVKEAMANDRWMRGLQRINSEEQMDQFVHLWSLIQPISLSAYRDRISWKLTSDGSYSSSSAYAIQFCSRLPMPELNSVWSIRVQGKVKFFFWLFLQNRLCTADRLCARGWPHDDKCILCDQEMESAYHLAFQCPFAKEVWLHFHGDSPAMVQRAVVATEVCSWWDVSRHSGSKEQRLHELPLAIYVIWHIWKERGRRIFQNKVATAPGVASLIRADVMLLSLAR